MVTRDPNNVGPQTDYVRDNAVGCGWAWLWFCLFIVVICFAGWGWSGWYGGWNAPWGWWGPRPVTQQQAGPREPANHPQATASTSGEFLGRTVTVSGQVEQVIGPHVFSLAGTHDGRELLVIDKNQKEPAVKKGETVKVTGTVEKFDSSALHQETNVDLSKVPSTEFTGRPTLVASSVAGK